LEPVLVDQMENREESGIADHEDGKSSLTDILIDFKPTHMHNRFPEINENKLLWISIYTELHDRASIPQFLSHLHSTRWRFAPDTTW
jgi:hypothetical protein